VVIHIEINIIKYPQGHSLKNATGIRIWNVVDAGVPGIRDLTGVLNSAEFCLN
jgi:hypothetical protein